MNKNQQKINQVIKFGICADNQDPYGGGRIRVIVDRDLADDIRSNENPRAILNKLDQANEKKYGSSAHIPWEIGSNDRRTDPYVVEPFLPKHVNVIPNIGESVKLIYYNVNDKNSAREYIGPQITTYDNTSHEDYESGRGFSVLSTAQPNLNDLRNNGFVQARNHVGLIGRGNSELFLTENSGIIRSGHRNNQNQTLDTHQGFLQISSYPIKLKREKQTTVNSTLRTKKISYLFEYGFEEINEEVAGNLSVFSVQNLNNKNYDTTKEYSKNKRNEILRLNIESQTTGAITSFISDFLNNLDNKRNIKLNFDEETEVTYNENVLKYTLIDNRITDNGSSFFDPLLYGFRKHPNNNTQVSKNIRNNIPNQLRPFTKVPQPTQETVEEDTIDSVDNKETYTLAGSDSFIFMTYPNDQTIQNKLSTYGVEQDDIYNLKERTQPMVRGHKLLEILDKIVNIIENHGHSTDGPNTISENVKRDINSLRKELSKRPDENFEGGSSIVNQNIRIT